MMFVFVFLCSLKALSVYATNVTNVTESYTPECVGGAARNHSIGPNGTFIDLSDMDTYEMNTKEMAAYAHRKFVETLKDGELGSWGQESSGFGPSDDDSSRESKSNPMDVFYKMEEELMDQVPITGQVMNDSRGMPYPPPPAHVRVRRPKKKKVKAIVNTDPPIIEDVFDDAGADDYYDEQNRPGFISRKGVGQQQNRRSAHGNQSYFRARFRSKRGLTYWLNQPARMFELEGVSIKPSPKHWPDPTHRTYNHSHSSGGFVRRPGVHYSRGRGRGGRLRFQKKT